MAGKIRLGYSSSITGKASAPYNVLLLGEIEPTKYTRLIDQIQEHLGSDITLKEEELEQWDNEVIKLCEKAIQRLQNKNPDSIATEKWREFKSYADDDSTSYDDWLWQNDEKELTYQQINENFRDLQDKARMSITYNK